MLAYSGGLDTSVLIKYLQEKYNAQVITVTVDVGQGEDLKAAEEKAKKLGVLKHFSIDAKDEFAKDYIFPAIKANALYEGKYPISTSLSRPLIAAKMVEIAEKEGATALAHGCTGRGNDQVRFDITLGSLAPDRKIIAPVREWGMTREEEIAYAKTKGIPVFGPKKHWWKAEDDKLLGLRPDAQVAMLLGVSEGTVRHRRNQLRISLPARLWKVTPPKPWPAEEIAMLGKATDAQLARRLGRSVTSVKTRRLRLGIASSRHRWTPEQDALLAKFPDQTLARRLGCSVKAIQARREGLGIPAPTPE